MSVGGRVQELLNSHGHSYAKAEELTGVCRETLRRICLGHRSPKLRKYIRQIADGYGLDEVALLEGASAKGEFEWVVRHASPSQRFEWALMTPAQRVKLTVDFLQFKYPDVVNLSVIAAACRMTEPELRSLVDRWVSAPPERAIALEVAGILHSLTGISRSWFENGGFAEGLGTDDNLARLASLAQASWPDAAKSYHTFIAVISAS